MGDAIIGKISAIKSQMLPEQWFYDNYDTADVTRFDRVNLYRNFFTLVNRMLSYELLSIPAIGALIDLYVLEFLANNSRIIKSADDVRKLDMAGGINIFPEFTLEQDEKKDYILTVTAARETSFFSRLKRTKTKYPFPAGYYELFYERLAQVSRELVSEGGHPLTGFIDVKIDIENAIHLYRAIFQYKIFNAARPFYKGGMLFKRLAEFNRITEFQQFIRLVNRYCQFDLPESLPMDPFLFVTEMKKNYGKRMEHGFYSSEEEVKIFSFFEMQNMLVHNSLSFYEARSLNVGREEFKKWGGDGI